MMTPEQFDNYKKRLHLPELGQEYLSLARDGKDGQPAAPARQAESRIGNMIVRYPSLKNQKVFTLESRRLEFAVALEIENDDDYVEWLTQPPTIEFEYRSEKGRRVPCNSTFDILGLRSKEVQLIEVKPEAEMRRLAKKLTGRYQQVDEHHWRSLPAEEVARKLGFTFRIWTDADFTRERIRNLKHWDPFLKLGRWHFPESEWKPVQDFLLSHPGISLDELGKASGVRGQALVRWMLAYRLVYCDLDAFVFEKSERARVYPNAAVARAMEALRVPEPKWPSVVDGNLFTPPPLFDEFSKALLKHGKEAFAPVYRKWRIIQGLVPKSEWDVTERSVSTWRHDFRDHGYLGLLRDPEHRQGNRTPRKLPQHDELARESINTQGMKPPKQKIGFFYSIFRSKCAEAKISIPSRTWFREIYRSVDPAKLVEAQEGKRAAFPLKFDFKALEGLWDSRGDYPFMDVHCDHTELSLFLRAERNGQLLRKPFFTVLYDATTWMVLAIYLSFNRPSRESLMMILRDCVRRHGRLPFGMFVDNGPEFGSVYFETFTGSRGIRVEKRPKAEPTFGHPIENFFGMTEGEFIQILEGSSLILKTPRKCTKSVDPRQITAWTMSELFRALEFYCFEIHNKQEDKELGKQPIEAMKELMAKHGIDQLPGIAFDNDFLIQTMPEVEDGTCRVIKPCCVKLFGDKFYEPRLGSFISRDLPTRWDPMDPGRVLVQLPEGWVECYSKYRKEVQGLSARDVQFFAQEVRARHAATARNRAQSDIERGDFFRELKETTEPELRRRLEEAIENQKVNSKLTTAAPSYPASANGESTSPAPPLKPAAPISVPKPAIRIKARNIL